MSSTEEYLDNLLRSVMGHAAGKNPEEENKNESVTNEKPEISASIVSEEPEKTPEVLDIGLDRLTRDLALSYEDSAFSELLAAEGGEDVDEDISNLLKSIEEMNTPLDDAASEDGSDENATFSEAAETVVPESSDFGSVVPEEEDTEEEEAEAIAFKDIEFDDNQFEDIASAEPALTETDHSEIESPKNESLEIDSSEIGSSEVFGSEIETAFSEADAYETAEFEDAGLEDTGLEDTGLETEINLDDVNLTELLSSLDEDSELSEIGNLLQMEENHEVVDDSLLNQPEETDFSNPDMSGVEAPLSEDVPEDEADSGKGKGKRKRKKKEKKEKEEKAGFFSRMMDVLTKDLDGEEEEPEHENKQVFEESAVDFAAETAAENQKIIEEMDGEEASEESKAKKGRKVKKKKEKKVKVKAEPVFDEAQTKKLPVRKVIAIFALCFSLGIIITVITYLIPYYKDTKEAQSFYDNGNYAQTYTALKGHNLNKKQQEIYDKSVVIMKEKRKLDSYEKYMKLKMPAQALDALLQGLKNAEEYAPYAEQLGVADQFNEYRLQIEEKVSKTFGLDLETAYQWSKIEDPQEYSENVYRFLMEKFAVIEDWDSVPESSVGENPVIQGEEEEFTE